MTLDVIHHIAEAGSDSSRDHRPVVREAAQAAYDALFTFGPHDPVPGVDKAVRHLVAARTAWLDGDHAATEWYLDGPDQVPGSQDLATSGADGEAGITAGRKLRAALRHVDLLVQRPAAATEDDLFGLIAAGWTPAEIVLIGQVIGFVTYQTRVAHALRVLAEENS